MAVLLNKFLTRKKLKKISKSITKKQLLTPFSFFIFDTLSRRFKFSEKQIIAIVVITLSSIFIFCYIFPIYDSSDKLEGLSYINYGYGFGFNPPEGWNLTENITTAEYIQGTTYDRLTITISQKNETDKHSDVYFQIFIYKPEVRQGYFLDTIIQNKLEELEEHGEVLTIESNNTRVNKDFNSYEIVWFVGSLNVKRKYVCNEKNGRVIYFYYSAPLELFEKYEEVFEESLSSLEIA